MVAVPLGGQSGGIQAGVPALQTTIGYTPPPTIEVDVGSTFTATGTGAVARTVTSKLGDVVAPEDFGALADGATDDSAAFNAAKLAGKRIALRANKVYVVKDLVLSTLECIEGNGAILRAATGARWVVQLAGYRAQLRNIEIEDVAALRLVRQTTLNGAVAGAATTITVATVTGIEVPMAVAVELDDGTWHKSLVTTIVGSVLTLERALPSAAASGLRVWATHAAVWLNTGALYVNVENVLLKGCYGGIVAKSGTIGVAGATKSTIANIRSYGAQMFGVAVHANASDLAFDGQLYGSTNQVDSYTGNGATTVYALSYRLFRVGASTDLTVTVAGVASVAGVGYTVTGARQITFAAAPANGAAIVITNSADGLAGVWVDQVNGANDGGHQFDLRLLDFADGVHLNGAQLCDFTGGFVDSISRSGLRIEGNTRNITFSGWQSIFAATSIEAVAGATPSNIQFTGLTTTLYPGGERQDGVTGVAVALPTAGQSITVGAASWAGTKTTSGAGTVAGLNGATQFSTPGGTQFRINNTTSAVNYVDVYGAPSGSAPKIQGGGAQGDLQVAASGSGYLYLVAPSGSSEIQFQTGASPNVKLALTNTGAAFRNATGIAFDQSVSLITPGGAVAKLNNTASAVGWLDFYGAAAGGSPKISPGGTTSSLQISAAGSGYMYLTIPSNGGELQVSAGGTPTARLVVSDAGVAFRNLKTTAAPANNGELMFEATSNTSLTLRYRGSDGVTRSVVLTLA